MDWKLEFLMARLNAFLNNPTTTNTLDFIHVFSKRRTPAMG
jgi:hypothetical protein